MNRRVRPTRWSVVAALGIASALGCGPSDEVPEGTARVCRLDADCAKGKYCSAASVCRQDCVIDAHCIGPSGGGAQCNVRGRCVPPASPDRPDAAGDGGGDAAAEVGGYFITPKGAKVAVRPALAMPAPPLDVVVPAALLVHPRPGATWTIPGARRARVLADGTELWELPGALTPAETVAVRDALVADGVPAELDLYRTAHALKPGDEGFAKQWALAQIKADVAWATTIGDPELVVAVVDTGYVDHPDLAGRFVPGYDFISDPANAGDGDGRDAVPIDVGSELASSSGFHGVHIAGIIGAATDNGVGMAGVDWRCRLQPVRVLGVKAHRGRDSDIADGIRWAAGLAVPGAPRNATPARVINLSFGGPGYSQVLQDAVLAAVGRGAVVVASAGNASDEASNNVPGSLEGVLSVAAAQPDGAMATYSNFGARVDFMSPGGAVFLDAPIEADTPAAIWSTSYVRGNAQPVFAFAAGTSQAAAYASGVAALVRAVAPGLPPEVVGAVLRRSAVAPPGDGCPQGCGDGLLDASRAVAVARDIAIATCGAPGCGGTNRVAPSPLKPEEGCAVSGVGVRGRGPFALVLVAALAARRRRRGGRPTWAPGVLTAWVLCGLGALGVPACSSAEGEREAQTSGGPTVKLVDPLPTYDLGVLRVVIPKAGRALTVTVTPDSEVEQVEVRVLDPEVIVARLGHGPWVLEVPGWVAEAEGGRTVCVTAVDAHARTGEICFLAVGG